MKNIQASGTENLFTDNVVKFSGGYGVYLSGVYGEISGNTFTGNNFEGNSKSSGGTSTTSIKLCTKYGNKVTGNKFEGNTFVGDATPKINQCSSSTPTSPCFGNIYTANSPNDFKTDDSCLD